MSAVESKMLAVSLIGTGGHEALRLGEVDRPVAGSGEVLVRIKAAGINPADYKSRQYGAGTALRGPDGPPIAPGAPILGGEGAGVIEAVGEGVTRFQPGDEVYYCDGGFGVSQGNYAQYKVLHEDLVAAKPRSLSFAEAAAIPLAFVTAWEAIVDRAGVRIGDYVLVQGGAGGVGHFAVQIAAACGARVAATCSTDAKAELARSLGAEKVIRYREEDVAEALKAWTGRPGPDLIFDTVGGEVLSQSLDWVAPYGTVVSCVETPIAPGQLTAAWRKNLRLAFEWMALPALFGGRREAIAQRVILERATALVEEGKLKPHVAQVLPLAQIGAAHDAVEQGQMMGKVVVEIP
jgi:NADPH2:quinone reductase